MALLELAGQREAHSLAPLQPSVSLLLTQEGEAVQSQVNCWPPSSLESARPSYHTCRQVTTHESVTIFHQIKSVPYAGSAPQRVKSWSPNDIYMSSSPELGYVTFLGKKAFADVKK